MWSQAHTQESQPQGLVMGQLSPHWLPGPHAASRLGSPCPSFMP